MEATKNPVQSAKSLVCFRGQHKVCFDQAVGVMVPNGQLHFSPGKKDIRVMPLRLRDPAYLVCESQRAAKVFEFVFLFQVMSANDLPTTLQFPLYLARSFPLRALAASFVGTSFFLASEFMLNDSFGVVLASTFLPHNG